MADLTTSANVDTLMQAANFAAFRTSLGLTALATTTPGTGVATALAINIGSAGAPVLFNGAGGTPSSLTGTNITGTAAGLTAGTASAVAVGGITGLGTGVGTFLATPTSANLLAAVTGETGTGALVFGSSPTIDAPTLTGTTTATTVNATNANVTNFLPVSNDGAAIGASGTAFSDLFLASGAVINFNAGNFTLTHSAGVLTANLDVRVTTPGTNSASVVTVGGTQTLTGKRIELGEGTQQIALDPALSADGTYSGIVMTGTSGYAQAFGDVVYLDPTDSRWEACDANAASGADGDCRGTIGMVVVAGTDGNACTILLRGKIRADANFPSFTINNPIYISETAGDVTQTQPTTTDVVIRIIGAALTADEMLFSPDNMWITHT